MSLRLRTALYALTVVCVVVGCLYAGASRVLQGGFTRLETETMLDNLSRAERAWEDNAAQLEGVAGEHAAHDDAYRFVRDRDEAYRGRELSPDAVANLGVNFFVVLDRAGVHVASQAVNLDWSVPVPLGESFVNYLTYDRTLRRHRDVQDRLSGLVVLPDAVLLVASAPVVTSEYRGPIRGSVVLGRAVDARATRAFGNLVQMQVGFYRLDDAGVPPDVAAARDELLVRGGHLSRALSDEMFAGYTLLDDLMGEPALLLQVQAPRTIHLRAQASLGLLSRLTLVTGVAACAVLLLLLRVGVLARFSRLSAAVRRVAASGDARARLRLSGRDELARLGGDIDRMLASLEAAQRDVRESEARYVRAVNGVNDGLWDWNLEAGTVYYSPRFAAMLGWGEGALNGDAERFLNAVHPEDLGRVRYGVDEHLSGRTPQFESEFRVRTPAGYRWMLSRALAVFENGTAKSITGSLTDISGRGLFDPLTGLPNRLLLKNRLEHLLADRGGDALTSAVLFLDLDRFKVINDSLGHHVGDLLLSEVARRLQGCVREGDTVARLGGDEFVLLVKNVDAEAVRGLLERLHAALTEPYRLDGHHVESRASVGVVTPLDTHRSAEDLLRYADIAMYEAKKRGEPDHLFEPALLEQAVARQKLEGDLRGALAAGELSLVYQPIVAPQRGVVAAFEALLRWTHPEHGPVSPGTFIPLAEETGLIVELGRWTLQEACRRLQEDAGGRSVVAVNLSPRQFADPDLAGFVGTLLRETGVSPARLKLEITESAVMEQPDRAIGVLAELRSLGVRLAMDDFGTGYSSLSYIHDLPIDIIKIDRSFVARLTFDDKSLEIVRTIMALAGRLGLEVVAEGVETGTQVAILTGLGCTLMQGYHYAKPLGWEDAQSYRPPLEPSPIR